MMGISLANSVVRRANILSTTVGDCVVLLDSDHEVFVGFDDIGSYIWHAVERPTAVADLCARLSATYDAEQSVIEGDVFRFLDQLLQQKLIEVAS
jgi:hypothetical protein